MNRTPLGRPRSMFPSIGRGSARLRKNRRHLLSRKLRATIPTGSGRLADNERALMHRMRSARGQPQRVSRCRRFAATRCGPALPGFEHFLLGALTSDAPRAAGESRSGSHNEGVTGSGSWTRTNDQSVNRSWVEPRVRRLRLVTGQCSASLRCRDDRYGAACCRRGCERGALPVECASASRSDSRCRRTCDTPE
jgi:hypothetical protein